MAWTGNNTTSDSELRDLVARGFSQFLPARVISIDQSEDLTNGNIICEILTPLATVPNQSQISASPLLANTKSYPLINEVVFLITGPSGDYSSNTGKVKYYYLSTLKIWNSIHTNPTPNPYENIKPKSQNKSIQEIEAGSTNKSGEQDTSKFKPGTYFQEKSDIYPLYPFEGDVIYEGRWGQSIRFGSTNIRTTNENETPLNVWSTTGSAGDPLLVFRNGQNPELLNPAQSTTIEDVNKDLSSLYLTSTQKLPIEVSSQNDYLSYGENKPVEPNQYSGAQAIINSGRLVFNSTQDHILLSSQKSINLNSQESVNIDARSGMIIQTPELYLGGIETAQPIVLGNDLVDLLGKVLTDLEYLTGTLQNQLGVPVGSPIGPTNLVAQAINDKIGGYKAELSNILSQTTKTV